VKLSEVVLPLSVVLLEVVFPLLSYPKLAVRPIADKLSSLLFLS